MALSSYASCLCCPKVLRLHASATPPMLCNAGGGPRALSVPNKQSLAHLKPQPPNLILFFFYPSSFPFSSSLPSLFLSLPCPFSLPFPPPSLPSFPPFCSSEKRKTLRALNILSKQVLHPLSCVPSLVTPVSLSPCFL